MTAPRTAVTISSVLAAVLALFASATGLLNPRFYEGWVPQSLVVGVYSQDLISVCASLILFVCVWQSRRGALWAVIVWPGVLCYFAYAYGLYAFDRIYTPLFIVYVAILSLSIYSLAVRLGKVDLNFIGTRLSRRAPRRSIALFLLTLILLVFPYVSRIASAVATHSLPDVNAVIVFDLAFVIPAAYIIAWQLWRRHAEGYALGAIMLTFTVILIASVIIGTLLQLQRGLTVEQDITAMLFAYGAVGAVLWGRCLVALRQ